MSRIVGIDYGTKRIGTAIGDTESTWVFPREVIRVGGADDPVERILALVTAEHAEKIVVGLPIREDGTEGGSAQAVRDFVQMLGSRADVPVELQDERMTSRQAEATLRAGRGVPDRKSGQVDALAAVLLLETYLERLRHGQ